SFAFALFASSSFSARDRPRRRSVHSHARLPQQPLRRYAMTNGISVGDGQVYYPATMNPDGSINPGIITAEPLPAANLPQGVTMPALPDNSLSSLQSPNVCTLSNPQGISPDTPQLSNADPYADTTDPTKGTGGRPTCAGKQKVSGGIVYGNATTTQNGTTLGVGLQTPGGPSFSNQVCSSAVLGNPGVSGTLGASVAGYSATGSLSYSGAAVQICSPVYGTPTSW